MPCLDRKECIEVTMGRIVSCEENKSRFRILNPYQKPIKKAHVDGCLIDDDKPKCDYFFEVIDNSVFYVEFKGTDARHALQQVVRVAQCFQISHKPLSKYAVIVTTRVPAYDADFQKALIQYKAKIAALGLEKRITRRNIIYEVTV